MTGTAYRWIIVAAGGLLGCVAMGSMFSLPVMLLAVAKATHWSVTGVSTAMTIAFLTMAVGGIGWGGLSDRIGARRVVLIGALLVAASLGGGGRTASLVGVQRGF